MFTTSPGSSRIEIRWGAVAIAVVIAIIGSIVLLNVDFGGDDEPAAPRTDIPLDSWAPYWVLSESLPELPERVTSMREVSPFWFGVTGVKMIEPDPNASEEQTAEFLDVARSSDAALVPSVVDRLPAREMARVLGDPELRQLHIDALVAFAAEGEYDGLDLDYEQFAFADGRSTWEETRPNWVEFIEELADQLHDDDRSLSVSVPPVYDDERTSASGFWVYDHGAIIDDVDQLRIMAYDYSVDEPGPIAPIDWVESSIVGVLEVTDEPEKVVLGIPAYGRNWPVGTSGDCEGRSLQGVTSVTNRSADALAERRGATPQYDVETAEWSFEYELKVGGRKSDCIQDRLVHYVDADGVEDRMDLAREYQLSGVSLWALGFEDDDVWEAILPTVSEPEAPADTESEDTENRRPGDTDSDPTDPTNSQGTKNNGGGSGSESEDE